MPAKRSSAGRKQHSVEDVIMTTDMELDSDLEDGFDPVQAATELQRVIEVHKKRRFAIRKKIESKYEDRVAEIAARTEKRLAERANRIAACRKEQLRRLVKAVELRDTQQRTAAEEVARFYDGCVNLASLLRSVYAGLAAEARSAVLTPDVDRA